MKKSIRNPAKMGLLMASFMLAGGIVSGQTYIASASGDWSSSLTWGGTPPPFALTAGETVTIDPGVTVTMDQNVIVNGTIDILGGTLSYLPHMWHWSY